MNNFVIDFILSSIMLLSQVKSIDKSMLYKINIENNKTISVSVLVIFYIKN